MRKIISIVLTLTLLLSFGLAAQAVDAAPEPAGYVYIMVDANVLDAGVFYGPARVYFYEDESAMDVTARFLGDNVIGADIGFVSGIVLPRNITVNVPEPIATALAEVDPSFPAAGSTQAGQTLGNGHFAAWAGWTYNVNNEQPDFLAGAVALAQGDVIRWEFTLRAGVCIGFDDDWDNTPAFIDRADRGKLIAAVANTDAAHPPELSNLLATQAEIDEAVEVVLAEDDTNIWRTVLSVAAIVVLAVFSGFAIFRFVRILASV